MHRGDGGLEQSACAFLPYVPALQRRAAQWLVAGISLTAAPWLAPSTTVHVHVHGRCWEHSWCEEGSKASKRLLRLERPKLLFKTKNEKTSPNACDSAGDETDRQTQVM